MKQATVDRLHALNARFYSEHADEFSATRERPWPGVARALSLARMQATERREAEAVRLNQILEARVKERTENLQEAITELEQFNSSISHDLRSPLGSVLNFSAILEEDYGNRLDEVGRNHLQRIAHCARVAVSMMDSLLAFSRVGREKLSHEPLDIRALVERRVAARQRGLREMGISPNQY